MTDCTCNSVINKWTSEDFNKQTSTGYDG